MTERHNFVYAGDRRDSADKTVERWWNMDFIARVDYDPETDSAEVWFSLGEFGPEAINPQNHHDVRALLVTEWGLNLQSTPKTKKI